MWASCWLTCDVHHNLRLERALRMSWPRRTACLDPGCTSVTIRVLSLRTSGPVSMDFRCSDSTVTWSWTGYTVDTRTVAVVVAAVGAWPMTANMMRSSGTASWTGTGPAWSGQSSLAACRRTWAIEPGPSPHQHCLTAPTTLANPPVACCASFDVVCTCSWDALACVSPADVQLLPRMAFDLVVSDFAIFYLQFIITKSIMSQVCHFKF